MPRRILVPVDGSAASTAALEHALDVHPDASFVLLHVVNPERWIAAGDDEDGDLYFSRELEEAATSASTELLDEAAATAREAGVDVETVQVYGQPARAILAYLGDHEVDGVVMGSRGRTGLDRLLLGSVAESVTRRADVPVTIVH